MAPCMKLTLHVCHVILQLFALMNVGLRVTHCQTLEEAKELNGDLLTGYNKDVRPINNQSAPMNVSVALYLRSIQKLDELTEEFYYTGAFKLNWVDDNISWDPSKYKNQEKTYISYQSVWVPQLILTTSSDDLDTMAKKWQQVKYYHTGWAEILVGGRVKATCGVNVQKYPFDKQVCTLLFQAWGYDYEDLIFHLPSTSAYVTQYTNNGQWELEKAELSTTVVDNWSSIVVKFHMCRKSGFVVVSLIAPLLFMSILNLLVFLLTPESGERVSYAITVLLAIAVFMTIISDALPSSSEPVPSITYMLMVQLIISSSITLITIFNLGIYHRNEKKPIPRCLISLYRCLCCRKPKTSVIFVTGNDEKRPPSSEKTIRKSDIWKREDDLTVTWKEISAMFDYIYLVVFSISTLLAFMIYIGIVAS